PSILLSRPELLPCSTRLPAVACRRNSANPPARSAAEDQDSAAGSIQKAKSRDRSPPGSAAAFRFATPRWPATYRSPCPRLLSASPQPGHTALAPAPRAIATPARWLRRAACRCTAKLLAG